MNIFKELYLVSLLIFGSFYLLLAQSNNRFYGGLKLGVNLAQIDGDGLYGYNRIGFNAGVMGSAYLANKTEFQMEFLYSTRGSRYGSRDNKILAYTINYLDVPLLFCYKDWFVETSKANYYKMHFQGGLSVGRLLSSSSIDQAKLNEKFTKTDLSWILGFSYYFNPYWAFSGRFTQSVIPLTRYVNQQGEETKMISYFISLGLIYRFN